MFSPAEVRLYPAFTQVKSFSGSGPPDGVEALVEFRDRFGDPTKAAGRLLFELFDYRTGWPDPRGMRIGGPWTGQLLTIDDQTLHWDRASRAYDFQLAFPGARLDHDYVLTLVYETTDGHRLFAQLTISGHHELDRRHGIPTTEPGAGQPVLPRF
jgi:hypothetical protein